MLRGILYGSEMKQVKKADNSSFQNCRLEKIHLIQG